MVLLHHYVLMHVVFDISILYWHVERVVFDAFRSCAGTQSDSCLTLSLISPLARCPRRIPRSG